MALSDSCREAKWLCYLLHELGLLNSAPLRLCVDNKGAEALAKNPSHHSCTKHIHTRYHFVRGCVSENVVNLFHVPTTEILADMFTKGLARTLLERHRKELRIV